MKTLISRLHLRATFLLLFMIMYCGVDSVRAQDDQFITTWQTTTANEYIFIPTGGGDEITDFNFRVDWGDGNEETVTGDDPDRSHLYIEAGTYTVRISGVFPHFQIVESYSASEYEKENAVKLQSIDQWGDVVWESMRGAFWSAENMIYNATDVPNLSQVTNMEGMFTGAKSFNGDLSNWDVSNVTTMRGAFSGASSFNGNISTWDVSSVEDLGGMFNLAESFNRDLSNWDVSSVTNMERTFYGASSFNADLSNWDVSNVTTMANMFHSAKSFKGDLSIWDVSKVTRMEKMFFGAELFNADLSSWSVSKVRNMERMFAGAESFDADLSNWYITNLLHYSGAGLEGFLEGAKLSTENYDALLIGWSGMDLTRDANFHAGNSEYTEAAEEARQKIIDEFGWTITDGGKTTATNTENKNDAIPEHFALEQNYPNPFNPSTTTKYAIPEVAEVRLAVYDLLGREVTALVKERQSAGVHTVSFDASSLSSGTYIYRIEAGDFTETRKLMLIK
ncbi:BspA family leucine-rich repeat surface protein [Gracilimonas sp.]|uniref:BspA family leucine-rich repeat surface protein n=1 Tax=Gracilimonas sp. TaxID=1974203 RepID=UPI002871AF77|nr:BspA family leucine-rich repeat surface protein [Gracilimonas sp.]